MRSIKRKDEYTEEGAKSLDLASLKVLYKWKHGKPAKLSLNKAKLLDVWNQAKNKQPFDRKTRTIEEQEEVDTLKTDVLHIQYTQVGRRTGKVIDDVITVLALCSQDQLKRLKVLMLLKHY